MARYRVDSIAQLALQMGFSPAEVRLAQIDRAEGLLGLIEAAKAYPLDFVIFKITEYRPKNTQAADAAVDGLIPGVALQHDLGLLIEKVSEGLDLHVSAVREPVLDIDSVCEKFNVTSKTIQRWRKRGLASRRMIFGDGRKRVGFLLGSVERFVMRHQKQVAAAANFSQVDDGEKQEILRRARRLATVCRCCTGEISRRIAQHLRRSPLTVLHTIRKHDEEHPDRAILVQAAGVLSLEDQAEIIEAHVRGEALSAIARRHCRPRSAIYRAIIDGRIERIAARKVNFIDDPLYHDADASAAMEAMVKQEELAAEPTPEQREQLRPPRDLPPFLADLYRTPLLTPGRERALFLKFNFHKFQFVQAHRRMDAELVRGRDLKILESHLQAAERVKQQIVQANLRLVVSIARKHLRSGQPELTLPELLSDGNLTLMRAVESFDTHRGNRFSTYATFALMKGFARSVPEMLGRARKHSALGDVALHGLADPLSPRGLDGVMQRDELHRLLLRLDERERQVLSHHFGLEGTERLESFDAVGARLGLSKERVRRIEQGAMEKLRAAGR